MTRTSVIVPTYQSARTLEACLRSIKQQTHPDTELIVVDNGSNDATPDIAHRYADSVINRGPERSAQRNAGAQQASGEYVLFIDSDMVLSEMVVSECANKLDQNESCQALVIPEQSFGQGFWAQCKALERSYYVGLDWMEAARCFRRSVWESLGGYNEANTGTEDYDLAQRVAQHYGASAIDRIEALIYHDEGRLSLLHSCKKKYYYARDLAQYTAHEANRAPYAKQASPLKRYQLYFSQPKRLLSNPLVGLGMIFMKTAEFAAGGIGYLTRSSLSHQS